jgi:hypothetical protein
MLICVCLRILASSRIPQYDLGRQTPHFLGDSVTDTLQGYVILIRISVTPSDMGEVCSLCSNVEVLYHHVHMRFMVMFNYEYLVFKNDDTKNG